VLPACAPLLADGGVVITGQNGVEAEDEALRHVPAASLAGGVIVIGASVAEPGVVRYHGLALALVGAARPEGAAAARLAVERLAAARVNVSFAPDLAAARWGKLVWNNAWNALTALTRLPVRAAASDAGVRELGIRMMREVEAVARAQGVNLPDTIVDVCLAQAIGMGDVKPSMLQDVEARRPLEHEALVGVVVRRGRELGVPTPVNDVVLPLLAALSSSAL
jgi:2-dehydropantoate 2-reductase